MKRTHLQQQQQLQQFKQQPKSRSQFFNRPYVQSQSQPQPQPEQQQDMDPAQVALFSRINNHLLFFWTPLVQVWTSSRLCVTLTQFQSMLQKIDFSRGREEFEDLRRRGKDLISLDKVLQGVNEWKRHDKDVVTFLEKQKQRATQNKGKGKRMKQQNKYSPLSIPFSSHNYKNKISFSSKQDINETNISGSSNAAPQRSRISNLSSSSFNAATIRASTKQHLQKKQQKDNKAIENLNQALIRTKNESNYELTIKIGQINDICKKLKNDICFLIVTKETKQDHQLQVVEKQGKSNSEKPISRKHFQKRYYELKTLSNNMLENVQGTLEKDLKETLVEVMYLSDELEKQIQLLRRKGVNSI